MKKSEEGYAGGSRLPPLLAPARSNRNSNDWPSFLHQRRRLSRLSSTSASPTLHLQTSPAHSLLRCPLFPAWPCLAYAIPPATLQKLTLTTNDFTSLEVIHTSLPDPATSTCLTVAQSKPLACSFACELSCILHHTKPTRSDTSRPHMPLFLPNYAMLSVRFYHSA